MARVKAFRGLRPPVEIVEKLASRPYDVLNSAEARIEAAGNPYSLLHVTKAEIDLPEGTDEHSQAVYESVDFCREKEQKGKRERKGKG